MRHAMPLRRSLLLTTLVAALLLSGAAGAIRGGGTAAATDQSTADLPVGHTVERMFVRGSAQRERRTVDVHLWYPADEQGLSAMPRSEYTSGLHGLTLIPELWDPLSWTVDAGVAREGAAIDAHGAPFPVIVFSHGSVNHPIDYAYTLEAIAGAGFVIAAPTHINNTQDDVRIDAINGEADTPLLACNDARPGPCSRPEVPFSMADRVSDIANVLDELPGWLGNRVDMHRVGVLGHSRGTVTALAAAGGSAPRTSAANCQASGALCWPLAPEHAHGLEQVKAIMGLAIAVPRVTNGANLANVSTPVLLLAGELDATSPPAVSEDALKQIGSSEEEYVLIRGATHRHFDSTYCDQTQAAGAIAQAAPSNAQGQTRAILDLHTIRGTVDPTPATSGRAMDYCTFSTFTSPTDIRPLVASLTGFTVTADNVPTTHLDTDTVKQEAATRAVKFFGTVLRQRQQ